MKQLQGLKAEMQALANPEKAQILGSFFRTGRGQYGEGDLFLGIMVPAQRRIAKKYSCLALSSIKNLLSSCIHEYRLTALFILIGQYQKSDRQTKRKIVDFYLLHRDRINNWDLVDLSAPNILGDCCYHEEDSAMLYRLSQSENLWERRMAIMATFAFIRKGRFRETLEIAEMLLHDRQDLIHKAVGWMLREIGKRDLKTEETFLDKYADVMPRTMLRYAIERFDQAGRRFWLSKGRV